MESQEIEIELIHECIRIFKNVHREFELKDPQIYGKTPQTAVIKYYNDCGSDLINYGKKAAEKTWRLQGEHVSLTTNSHVFQKEPVCKMFFYEASFWISSSRDRKKAFLIYQLGPRYARAFSYEIAVSENGKISLSNESLLWVS